LSAAFGIHCPGRPFVFDAYTAFAILYSIIETAKQNDLDPYRYLSYIFTAAPNCDISDPKAVDTLLPNMAPDVYKITVKQTTLSDWD